MQAHALADNNDIKPVRSIDHRDTVTIPHIT